MRKYGESKTTRIMMATAPYVTSGLGLRTFQADGFLLTRVYQRMNTTAEVHECLHTVLQYVPLGCAVACEGRLEDMSVRKRVPF